jgi:DNA-binding MarR family transcriptional regulator
MNTYNQEYLNGMKTSDIVGIYNAHAEKLGATIIKKFRDKATAISRTLVMQEKAIEEYEKAAKVEPTVALTDKEHVALMAIAQNGLDGMGGKEPADLLGDNYSWFDNDDLVKLTGMTKHQCSGLMSALEQKGLAANSEEGVNGQGPDLWYLSNTGIDMAQTLKDEPLPEIKKEAKKPAKVKSKGNSKGNSKTELSSKVEIAKSRDTREGSIGYMMFGHINDKQEQGLTVQELVDYMVANYSKPRSDVPITKGFVIDTIRYFLRNGNIKLS